jgi:hypothetical protein
VVASCTFFAEDVFGVQVGVLDNDIVQFDPETATLTLLAHSIEEWCEQVVADQDFYTGAPVLAAWEQAHGPIRAGNRLIPKRLFMFGGEYHSTNMLSKRDVEGMQLRAQYWRLTKDLPDGTSVTFNVVD